MQGKSYTIYPDVTNELTHEIIKGIELIFKYQWYTFYLTTSIDKEDKSAVWGSLKVEADSVEEYAAGAHYAAQESWLREVYLLGVTLEFAELFWPLP